VPRESVYNTTLHILAGILMLGLNCNRAGSVAIKQVAVFIDEIFNLINIL